MHIWKEWKITRHVASIANDYYHVEKLPQICTYSKHTFKTFILAILYHFIWINQNEFDDYTFTITLKTNKANRYLILISNLNIKYEK